MMRLRNTELIYFFDVANSFASGHEKAMASPLAGREINYTFSILSPSMYASIKLQNMQDMKRAYYAKRLPHNSRLTSNIKEWTYSVDGCILDFLIFGSFLLNNFFNAVKLVNKNLNNWHQFLRTYF
jgi:hypothetical protein